MRELVGFHRESGYRVASNFYISAHSAVKRCEIAPIIAEYEHEFHNEKVDLDGGNQCLR